MNVRKVAIVTTSWYVIFVFDELLLCLLVIDSHTAASKNSCIRAMLEHGCCQWPTSSSLGLGSD